MKNLIVATLFLVLFGTACQRRQAAVTPISMDVYALRLHPGQDLRHELEAFTREKNLEAGFVVTCVGSLQRLNLRPANQQTPLTRVGKFEIVSLVGTLSPDGPHLHIAVSDSTGMTLGGHLLEGNEIFTTAEIVVGSARNLRFRRETDPQTTFKELKIDESTH